MDDLLVGPTLDASLVGSTRRASAVARTGGPSGVGLPLHVWLDLLHGPLVELVGPEAVPEQTLSHHHVSSCLLHGVVALLQIALGQLSRRGSISTAAVTGTGSDTGQVHRASDLLDLGDQVRNPRRVRCRVRARTALVSVAVAGPRSVHLRRGLVTRVDQRDRVNVLTRTDVDATRLVTSPRREADLAQVGLKCDGARREVTDAGVVVAGTRCRDVVATVATLHHVEPVQAPDLTCQTDLRSRDPRDRHPVDVDLLVRVDHTTTGVALARELVHPSDRSRTADHVHPLGHHDRLAPSQAERAVVLGVEVHVVAAHRAGSVQHTTSGHAALVVGVGRLTLARSGLGRVTSIRGRPTGLRDLHRGVVEAKDLGHIGHDVVTGDAQLRLQVREGSQHLGGLLGSSAVQVLCGIDQQRVQRAGDLLSGAVQVLLRPDHGLAEVLLHLLFGDRVVLSRSVHRDAERLGLSLLHLLEVLSTPRHHLVVVLFHLIHLDPEVLTRTLDGAGEVLLRAVALELVLTLELLPVTAGLVRGERTGSLQALDDALVELADQSRVSGSLSDEPSELLSVGGVGEPHRLDGVVAGTHLAQPSQVGLLLPHPGELVLSVHQQVGRGVGALYVDPVVDVVHLLSRLLGHQLDLVLVVLLLAQPLDGEVLVRAVHRPTEGLLGPLAGEVVVLLGSLPGELVVLLLLVPHDPVILLSTRTRECERLLHAVTGDREVLVRPRLRDVELALLVEQLLEVLDLPHRALHELLLSLSHLLLLVRITGVQVGLTSKQVGLLLIPTRARHEGQLVAEALLRLADDCLVQLVLRRVRVTDTGQHVAALLDDLSERHPTTDRTSDLLVHRPVLEVGVVGVLERSLD